jgi:hypothetical protein
MLTLPSVTKCGDIPLLTLRGAKRADHEKVTG